MNTIWDPRDKYDFDNWSVHECGQITLKSKIGQFLFMAGKNKTIQSYLEVGTWNGYGSTRCIIEGLKRRNEDTPSYVFYSLECNPEKCKQAQDLYKDIPNVHILNEVFLNNMPSDIYNIFPELKENATFRYWNSVDFDNMKNKSLFTDRKDLPEMFDVVLLDGGEFTTWYEYLEIKDRCKILALDDTTAPKCKQIVKEIKAQPKRWKIILDDPKERNGSIVAQRIDI